MKKNILIIFLFSLTLFSSANSQSTLSEETFLLKTNLQILNQHHFLEKSINEKFFSEVFEHYLKEVDRYKIFLTQAQVAELNELKIPQESLETTHIITGYTEEFLNENIALIRKEIKLIMADGFDFTIDENFNNEYKELSYPENLTALIQRWRQRLKYQVLTQTLTKTLPDTNFTQVNDTGYNDPDPEDRSDQNTVQSYADALGEAVQDIEASALRLLSNIETLKKRDFLNSYINAIGATYDEYTRYLPPVQKETFDIRLSGQLEGIGAEIRKATDGLIEIVRILPGGASYRQKGLKAGDKIIKVAQNDNTPVDIRSASLNEALKLIRGKKGTLVQLTVKKKTGAIVIIPIIRDKVILEETYARSAIFSKNDERYGYIYLPKFYRDFDDAQQRTSTEDVRRELLYLNNQNIDGLIFDIRNNGGGSLEDAILMSGLFITEGPITRVRNRTREFPAYRDKDPGIAFSQPMIILVNGGSASASEIFAAALQDYDRAIIVGAGAKTFGKGTVQTLFDLGRLSQATAYSQNIGYLKFTIQKYYRITGQSTQLQGVSPNIILPSLFPATKSESAFTNDSLPPIVFPKWRAYSYPMEELATASAKRVRKNRTLQNITKRNELIKKYEDQTLFTLQYKKAFADRQSYLSDLIQYKIDLDQDLDFLVIAKPASAEEKQKNGFAEKRSEKNKWYQSLAKDIYIQETIAILSDALQT